MTQDKMERQYTDNMEQQYKDILQGNVPDNLRTAEQRAYLQLLVGLEAANSKLQSDPLEARRTALHYAILYLDARLTAGNAEPSSLLIPLLGIREALFDQYQEEKSGLKSMPVAKEDLRAATTAAVAFLIEHGHGTEEAHKFVERELANNRHKATRGLIYQWFRDQEKNGDKRARRRYDSHVRELARLRDFQVRSGFEAFPIAREQIGLAVAKLKAAT